MQANTFGRAVISWVVLKCKKSTRPLIHMFAITKKTFVKHGDLWISLVSFIEHCPDLKRGILYS
jgi:hypothetical protein